MMPLILLESHHGDGSCRGPCYPLAWEVSRHGVQPPRTCSGLRLFALRLGFSLLQAQEDEVSQLRRQQFQQTEQRTKNKKMIPVLTQVSFVRTDRSQWETRTPDVGIKPQRLGGLHKPSGAEQQIIIHKCRQAQAATEVLALFLCFILPACPVRVTLTESFWQLKINVSKVLCRRKNSLWLLQSLQCLGTLKLQELQLSSAPSLAKLFQTLASTKCLPRTAESYCSGTRILEQRAGGRVVHRDTHCRAIILASAASWASELQLWTRLVA